MGAQSGADETQNLTQVQVNLIMAQPVIESDRQTDRERERARERGRETK